MTNTQHAELMAVLTEIRDHVLGHRTAVERIAAGDQSAAYGGADASIPAGTLVTGRAATLGPVVDGATGERDAQYVTVGTPARRGKRGRK